MSPPNAYTDVAGTQTLELATVELATVELAGRFLGPSVSSGVSLLSALLKGVRGRG